MMVFGMEIMPLEPTLNPYFLSPTISSNINIADAQTLIVGATLLPLHPFDTGG
jgi:hypothetical protein